MENLEALQNTKKEKTLSKGQKIIATTMSAVSIGAIALATLAIVDDEVAKIVKENSSIVLNILAWSAISWILAIWGVGLYEIWETVKKDKINYELEKAKEIEEQRKKENFLRALKEIGFPDRDYWEEVAFDQLMERIRNKSV